MCSTLLKIKLVPNIKGHYLKLPAHRRLRIAALQRKHMMPFFKVLTAKLLLWQTARMRNESYLPKLKIGLLICWVHVIIHVDFVIQMQLPVPRLNIKTVFLDMVVIAIIENKRAVRPSHLWNKYLYTGKMTHLYQDANHIMCNLIVDKW